ncbi:hypothetical protein CHS0354_029801 [Potamilus streckersoni]|uniref:Carboxylic ester hydrolase n=1 Tax=Potamilus streckersoni TaxID=2493646 RepID=A0AAE0THJ7_9BIVA|nr:hypothetical protein CHS0354_029801 [Potamilus streckersoni]
MVFIHGGNFVHESGGTILYDGEAFVQKTGVILVNINYRLGALGFLFTGTGPDDIRGNYGIKDQRQALIWVNQNIANFGGDHSKVTIFGQSAGAQSIAIHLMNAKSDAYFHQAIIESAPLDIPYKKTIDDLFLGNTIADLLNCSSHDVQCLRSKSADQIAKAETEARSKITSLKVLEFFEPLGPRVDGDEVLMEPMQSIRQRQFRDIPVIIGSVSEETRIYIYLTWKSPISTALFETVLFAVYPSHIEEILKEYPVQNKTDVRDHLAQLATDFIFTCTVRNASQSFSQKNKSPVWLYSFDHAFSFLGWEPFSFCEHHVCHGSELPYVFYTAPLGNFRYTADEEKLSSQLMSYWANFAFTGNPNTGPHPVELEWPSYDASQAWPLMHFQTPSSSVINDYRSDYCTFWDSIGYKA